MAKLSDSMGKDETTSAQLTQILKMFEDMKREIGEIKETLDLICSSIGTIQKTSETVQVTLVELQERVLEERKQTKTAMEELRQEHVELKESLVAERAVITTKLEASSMAAGVHLIQEGKESTSKVKTAQNSGGALGGERKASYTGESWSMRSMGKEQGHQRTEGRENDPIERGDGGSIGHTVTPPKMEFPPYDGSTDAVEWLQKCDDYFDDHRVFNDDAKVRQAMFVLTGPAFNWNNNLLRLITHRLGWEEFKRICKSRFGKVDDVNPLKTLSNLKQTGTVDEYCDQFKECVGRQTRLTGDHQLWLFCAGLTDNLRREVEYLRPKTTFEAMEYARDNEYKIDGDKWIRTFGGYLAPRPL